jgi:predicted component of type VI protein secretion system
MRNKIVGLLALFGLCFVLTGCSSVQGYSVRSYQGPLPLDDFQFLNPDADPNTVSAR